jgi:hypothetical protein
MVKTPVAFLIFNRPDTTQKVFDAIRQAKPEKLLVVADGPRADRPGEAEKCEACRAIIDGVDWECEILTNYSDVNLGCKRRVSSGLDWVFQQVEEAIILEDDCLPHTTFFRFCEELLEFYKTDTRIVHINGTNNGIITPNSGASYRFSKLTNVWGWASWRRAWKYYDVNITFWTELVKQKTLLDGVFTSKHEIGLRSKIWQDVYDGKIDSWDYQWYLTCICQSGISIVPNQNLVSNIGFGFDATHTKNLDHQFANLSTEVIEFPLVHPLFLLKNTQADDIYFNQMYDQGIIPKIHKKFKQLIKR